MAVKAATTARSFDALASPDAGVLVLGSMPGQASLGAQQYYAHPRNAFWPIMSALFGVNLDTRYAERCACIVAQRVAVWDVLQSCERPGSLDADIVEKSIVANDFTSLFAKCPNLRHVFFNGAKAETAYRRYVLPSLDPVHAELATTRLPSTSPAHASLSVEQKAEQWQVVKLALSEQASVT
ncbi:MAG: DNA-deoxyinosine glycosylase [Gammaproteobacteria bacterium]